MMLIKRTQQLIRFNLLCLLFCCFIFKAKAQILDRLSNPQILVKINHPPGLGLKVNKVAFTNATGNCSDQVITALISDFVSNNIEVLDRENLVAVLAEHKLNLSSFSDKNKIVEIGKIIGPTALISVKILRCETKVEENLVQKERVKDPKTKLFYDAIVYVSRTRAFLKVSIQTTDLTTNRVFAAKNFEYSPVKENKSYDGRPVAPDRYDVQDLAFQNLAADVHKMFIPWTSESKLYYYDDKDGNLKQAFLALKSGDLDQALALSKQNLETCKKTPDIKEKTLAHAYYNLGMSYMTIGDYDNALVNFNEAQKVKPGAIIMETIAECQQARKEELEMRRVDEKAIIEISKMQTKEAQLAKANTDNTLTNEDIINLTKLKLSNSLIMQKIKNSNCNFDTSASGLVKLSKAGVNESVILLMIEKK